MNRRWACILPSAALLLTIGILLGRAGCGWYGAAGAALIGLGLCLHPRGRLPGAAVLALAAGYLLAWCAWHPVTPPPGSYEISGIVCDEAVLGERGHLSSRLTRVTLDGKPAAGDAYWTGYLDEEQIPPEPGQRVRFQGTVYLPEGADNPGGFDFRDFLLAKGVRWCVYGGSGLSAGPADRFSLRGWFAALRHRWTRGLAAAMGEEAGGYAAAMLLGTRVLISSEDQDAFRRLGIAHVLSVSGFHAGILVLALNGLLRKRSPWFRSLIHLIVLSAYALLTGGNAPVIRAALLVLLADAARLRHRQAFTGHTLCAAWILCLLWRPALLLSAGFQLSYAALAGIVLAAPSLQRAFTRRAGWLRKAGAAYGLGAAAQLGVLLPELYWYQELPLLGVLVSPLVLLYAGTLILLYWLTLFLLPVPFLAGAAGSLSGLLTGLLLKGVRSLAKWPGLMLWTRQANLLTLLGWLLLLLGLSALWTRRRKLRAAFAAVGAAVLLLSLVPLPHRGTEYIQLSLGNEDAAVLWDEDSVTVIDAGADGRALAAWLRQRRLSVDTLILTHLHTDHAGGVRALLEQGIPIGAAWLGEGAEDALIDEGLAALPAELAAAGVPVRHVSAGDRLDLPSGSLTVLWPEAGKTRPGQDANLYSLTLLARLRGSSLLLTGDLDGRYERYAAQPADILKAAHHGSAASTGEDFLARVAPAVVINSGKPDRQDALAQRLGGIPLYGTGRSGAITVRFTEAGSFSISGYLPDEEGDSHGGEEEGRVSGL